MQEMIRTIIVYVVILGLILMSFYLYKHHRYSAEVGVNDRSMTPEFPTGSYTLDTSGSIHVDDAVAFALADTPDVLKVARVVALSGAKVEIDATGAVKINGVLNIRKSDSVLKPVEFRVPQGCAFLLTDQGAGMDSSKLGPIPLSQIFGRVKP
jgi:hypothetical protein